MPYAIWALTEVRECNIFYPDAPVGIWFAVTVFACHDTNAFMRPIISWTHFHTIHWSCYEAKGISQTFYGHSINQDMITMADNEAPDCDKNELQLVCLAIYNSNEIGMISKHTTGCRPQYHQWIAQRSNFWNKYRVLDSCSFAYSQRQVLVWNLDR